MAFCRIAFSILVLSIVNSIATSQSLQFFMWGDGMNKIPSKSNPLSSITTEGLRETIKSVTRDVPLIVVFLEETLSVEDFAQKDIKGDTAFPYLQQNLDDAIYFPAVKNPVEALETLPEPYSSVYSIDVTEFSPVPTILNENGNLQFINFKDAKEGESRFEMLHRHNNVMEQLVNDLESKQEVVAIYTAHFPSWMIPETHSRVRRQLAANEPLSFENLLLDVSRVTVGVDGKSTVLSNLAGNTSNINDTNVDVTLAYENFDIELQFVLHMGYWSFEKVVLTQKTPENFVEDLLPATEIYALNGSSYRCAQEVMFLKAANVNSTRKANITFFDLQIQPFFSNYTTANQTFGDSFNCVGFFTAPIWSGLFVVFILLTITFYGIMMMMDIRTMDRFDDPKGKTITINASE